MLRRMRLHLQIAAEACRMPVDTALRVQHPQRLEGTVGVEMHWQPGRALTEVGVVGPVLRLRMEGAHEMQLRLNALLYQRTQRLDQQVLTLAVPAGKEPSDMQNLTRFAAADRQHGHGRGPDSDRPDRQ